MTTFWDDYLKGLNFEINLPKLPRAFSFPAESISYDIEPKIAQLLTHCFGSRIDDVFFASFAILVSFYSGQADLLIGKPPLPIRIYVDSNQTFEKFLEYIETKNQEVQGKAPPNGVSPHVSFQEKGSDLCLFYDLKNERITFHIESREGFYNQKYLHHFAANLIKLLEQLIDHPHHPICAVEYVNREELKEIFHMGRGKSAAYPKEKTVHRVFEENVLKFPNHLALRYIGQSISYSDLNAQANQLACHLQQLGIKKGDFVGLAIDRSADHVLGILGILKADATPVPIDATYPLERKLFMLGDVNAKVLVTQDSYKDLFPISELLIFCLDSQKEQIKNYPKENLQGTAGPLDLVNINYTSGSTGKPKGVKIPHKGLIRLVVNTDYLAIEPEDRMLHMSNVSFDGSSFELWGALLNGACLCIYPHKEFSAAELADFVENEKVSHALFTARLFNLLVDYKLSSLHSLRFLFSGGDVMSVHHAKLAIEALPNCVVVNAYGPTENSVITSTFPIHEADQIDQVVPIGFPIANTDVYILDSYFHTVPIGVIGEIFAGGDGVANGYLNREELTKERFIPNPFGEGRLYRTGDLGRFLPNGAIEFFGRIDTQVKIRGNRIELGEIEEVLRGHPKVSDGVVLARDDKFGDKKLVAYAEAKANESLSIDELRSYLESRLIPNMMPAFVIVMPKLPITANGKVDRKALPPPEEIINTEVTFESSMNPIEELIADIWGTLLELPHIGLKDNFFYLGGHSIAAAQLNIVIEQSLNVKVPMGLIFEEPILERYAKKVSEMLENLKEPKNLPITKSELFWIWRNRESKLNLTLEVTDKHLPKVELNKPQSILLTGATGFIGTFMLKELIDHTTAQIFCLIRADSLESAKMRLESSLKKYGLWNPEIFKKIIPLIGDLENPDFYNKQLKSLENEIDCIFHNGAYVNHSLPYSKLKAANVLGTKELLKFACSGQIKPFHFISTVAVFEGRIDRTIYENDNLDESKILINGYAQSKWIGEKLVMKAREIGLPTNIYRLARVSGHSITGQGNADDFLWRMAEASIYLKLAPDIGLKENITPIDFVCRAIRTIASNSKWNNNQYHVINPQLFAYKNIYHIFQKLGYSLEFTPYETWRKTLVQASIETAKDRLQAIAPLFSEIDLSHSDKVVIYGSDNLQRVLKESNIVCPIVDEEIIKIYINTLVAKGFIPPYQTSAQFAH